MPTAPFLLKTKELIFFKRGGERGRGEEEKKKGGKRGEMNYFGLVTLIQG
jgi:hypothetical protein